MVKHLGTMGTEVFKPTEEGHRENRGGTTVEHLGTHGHQGVQTNRGGTSITKAP
jgi:hypothetical protein